MGFRYTFGLDSHRKLFSERSFIGFHSFHACQSRLVYSSHEKAGAWRPFLSCQAYSCLTDTHKHGDDCSYGGSALLAAGYTPDAGLEHFTSIVCEKTSPHSEEHKQSHASCMSRDLRACRESGLDEQSTSRIGTLNQENVVALVCAASDTPLSRLPADPEASL